MPAELNLKHLFIILFSFMAIFSTFCSKIVWTQCWVTYFHFLVVHSAWLLQQQFISSIVPQTSFRPVRAVLKADIAPVYKSCQTWRRKWVESCKNQHETISFIARSVTRNRRHASSARRLKEHSVIVLILSQLQCLEMGRGFHFKKKVT